MASLWPCRSSSLSRHLLTLAALMFAHLSALQSVALASLAAQGGVAPAAPAAVPLSPGAAVIASLPPTARGAFLRYQLGRAVHNPMPRLDIPLERDEAAYNFAAVPVYAEFGADLLRWLHDRFNISGADVARTLRLRTTIFCTLDGVCYQSDDIGQLCCPF